MFDNAAHPLAVLYQTREVARPRAASLSVNLPAISRSVLSSSNATNETAKNHGTRTALVQKDVRECSGAR